MTLPRLAALPEQPTQWRPVRGVVHGHRFLEGEGFQVRRRFPGIDLELADPFLLLDHMGAVEYGPGEAKGAPWHPHRGFETVPYMDLHARPRTARLPSGAASTAVAIRGVTCGDVWLGAGAGVGQPPVDHVFVKTTGSQAAAAVRIGARLAGQKLGELFEGLRSCFRRTEPFVQAGKYVRAVMSEMPTRNGWTIAEYVGDRTPDKTRRLLNRASWDEAAAMAQIRRFAVVGLNEAARKAGRRRGRLVIGALDETGQQKKGEATAGVTRQHMGCAGRVENGINTVHLSYVREGVGHALVGFRQWIPDEHITDPVRSLRMGLPLDLRFRTKGQLGIDICTTAAIEGIRPDFYCGDEVYCNCTELRTHFEADAQAYVLRVAKNVRITLPGGTVMSCDQAVRTLLQGRKHQRRWEIRSAGKGSKGDRWYAWAWIATNSARHYLLIRKHLRTGELAFHYCFVPEGQLLTKARLVRAAGLRWPVEEGFEFGKDCFGLDQSQVRLYTAIARHTVLVCAALAVCAVTAALLRDRTDSQAPEPPHPNQPPPADPGSIPLTIPEIKHPIAAALAAIPRSPGHTTHWVNWRRRHQARSHWFHKRTRLAHNIENTQVS